MRGLALVLLLAGCGREAPEQPAPSFRDAGAPIGSAVGVTPEGLAGEWVVSAAFPGRLGLTYAVPGALLLVETTPGGTGQWTFDPVGEAWVVIGARSTAPGRYALGWPGLSEVWILWADADLRTAVVGTPDGTFGWIMDRPGEASPDRTNAAREMLDFNGYVVSALR